MAFRGSDLQEAFFVPGTQPFRARPAPRTDHQDRPGAARVQDFGSPGDPTGGPGAPAPDVAPAPVKRGRGRPPGSKTKKPA